ncbi:MAG: MGMT family protein [Candidatus Levybacteria bacterium]|nr:MGMT family protein [Candidatus Levybacteria bacterium]
MNTFESIYDIVAKIPKGKVTTYGAISKLLSIDPRVVGFALHANKDPENIPCHRVINSKGKISAGFAFGGPDIQQQMLEKEGVEFDKGKGVDLNKFGYFLS